MEEIKDKAVIGSMQKNAYHGDTNGSAPTLTEAMGAGGGQIHMVVEKGQESKPPIELQEVGNILRGQTAWESNQRGRVYDAKGLSPTLNTHTGGGFEPKFMEGRYRIRKLTERECFRLMDVDEADIDTIQAAGISRTQQYKMAGNSIVVSCLFHLFRKLFVEPENEYPEQTLW